MFFPLSISLCVEFQKVVFFSSKHCFLRSSYEMYSLFRIIIVLFLFVDCKKEDFKEKILQVTTSPLRKIPFFLLFHFLAFHFLQSNLRRSTFRYHISAVHFIAFQNLLLFNIPSFDSLFPGFPRLGIRRFGISSVSSHFLMFHLLVIQFLVSTFQLCQELRYKNMAYIRN